MQSIQSSVQSWCRQFVVVALTCTIVGGCGPTAFDARFESSPDDDIFGTLIDDRGSFEFIRNPETGNLQRVETPENNDITLPTDGQDFAVARSDGSSVTVGPEGASDAFVVVRDDAVLGDANFTVDRASLGGIGDVIRPNERRRSQDDLCADNQDFMDAACGAALDIDVSAVAGLLHDDLESQGVSVPTAQIEDLLNRYLVVVVDCCLAWDEFRSSDGDACAE